jgi:hypothetical protein
MRGNPDERRAKRERKAQERAELEAARQFDAARRAEAQARAAFDASPPGRARLAKQSGQRFFQIVLPIEDVDRTWMAKFAHEMDTRVLDTSDAVGVTLTAIEDEGWELVTAGFTFRETAQASRDKFLASGQQIATIGQTLGVYLFKAVEEASPWAPRDAGAWECMLCNARLSGRVEALQHADQAHPEVPIEEARAAVRQCPT